MWELSIDADALTAAATEYTTAATSYETALTALEGQLNNAETYWQDKSSEEWKTKVADAKAKMNSVCERMKSNADVLNAIAAAATETEGNINTGISSL